MKKMLTKSAYIRFQILNFYTTQAGKALASFPGSCVWAESLGARLGKHSQSHSSKITITQQGKHSRSHIRENTITQRGKHDHTAGKTRSHSSENTITQQGKHSRSHISENTHDHTAGKTLTITHQGKHDHTAGKT